MGIHSSTYEMNDVEQGVWERIGNTENFKGCKIVTRKMFFQYDKKNQIKESLERVEMLIKMMGFSCNRGAGSGRRQIFWLIADHKKQIEYHMVFYLNKSSFVEWIRIFQTGLEGPSYTIKVNKKNYRKVLKVIRDFELQI